MSVASDVTLNFENSEVWAHIPDLQIDLRTLFPDLTFSLQQKKKISEKRLKES